MIGRCSACHVYGFMDRAHLKTRGSGGNDFSDTNAWILLCRKHHIMQGSDGWWKFCNKYPHLFTALRDRGWVLEEVFGVMKLVRQNEKK